jgi:uncharacterized membrane protein YccC
MAGATQAASRFSRRPLPGPWNLKSTHNDPVRIAKEAITTSLAIVIAYAIALELDWEKSLRRTTQVLTRSP